MKEKVFRILSKIEILIPAVLFVLMLVTCGMYLDIKMNGRSSTLPSIPEKEKRLILRSNASESESYVDDLLEPVFVGVKHDDKKIAAIPDDESRKIVEQSIYSSLVDLFSGTSKRIDFESEEANVEYIESLKNSDKYMLIGFFCDIPSAAFLPCIVNGYDHTVHDSVFNIRNLFLIPDVDDNLSAVAISSDYDVNVISPKNNIPFNKINAETYDISDGWSYFEFSDKSLLQPELTNSLFISNYQIKPAAVVYGKEPECQWVDNCLEVFSINSNLVKSFTSGDRHSVNYVEQDGEIIIDDMGFVEYKALDDDGINLEEYLGYAAEEGSNYAFSDKVFALKKIINSLNIHNDNVSYSLVGFEHNDDNNTLLAYFKYFSDGILLSQDSYDAVFEIHGNNLVYAKYKAIICSEISEKTVLIPQKYSSVLIDKDNEQFSPFDVYCPIMFSEDDDLSVKTVKWAKVSSALEVID